MVTGSLSLVVPVFFNDDKTKRDGNVLFDELLEHASRVFISLPWGQVTKLSAERLKSAKSYLPYEASKRRQRPRGRGGRLLKVTADVKGPADATFSWSGGDFVLGDHPRLGLAAAEDRLIERVSLLFVAAQIAAPGLAHFAEPRVFRDDEPRGVGTPVSWILHEARYAADKYGWPRILRLPISDADEWLAKVPGTLEGMGTGRTGRAIAALTHILCKSPNESSEMGIAWALLGLEALYAEGTQGLSQQILRKTEVLLGERSSHKKRLQGVYAYRSRFLHGDIDIPLAYTEHRMDPPDDGTFMIETYDYWSIATTMLVATLQEMVRRGLWELKFSLTLDAAQPGAVSDMQSLRLLP